jgi:integrase
LDVRKILTDALIRALTAPSTGRLEYADIRSSGLALRMKISRGDVIQLIEELIAAGTPSLANSVHALVSSMFTFALDNGLVHGSPCARLKKRAAENIGRRVLTDAEIRLFWPKVVHAPVSRRVGLALRLALLTGARAGEIAGMSLVELAHLEKPDAAEWVIPAERSKNGRAHVIPLGSLAVDTILAATELITDDDEFVFPSPSADGPITGRALAVAMKRFATKLTGDGAAVKSWKAEPPTPHDLRRTFATRLSALGIPKEDRDSCMNHTRSDVGSKHYDLYERRAEKHHALTLWGDTLLGLLTNSGAEVVPLKKIGAGL